MDLHLTFAVQNFDLLMLCCTCIVICSSHGYRCMSLLCLQLIWVTALQLLNSQQHVGVGKKEQETLETAITGQGQQTSSSPTYTLSYAAPTLSALASNLSWLLVHSPWLAKFSWLLFCQTNNGRFRLPPPPPLSPASFSCWSVLHAHNSWQGSARRVAPGAQLRH